MSRRWDRRKIGPACWVFALALGAAPALAPAQVYKRISRSDLKTLQESFADLAEEVMPSVVAIRTYSGLRPLSQGSGVIFRPNGFILTNYHVVEDARRILVILHNGMEHEATLMQIDDRSDLAVIKVDADDLRAASFGNLADVRIGHWTFAIGNPFGLSNFTGATSFSVGNVSSIGRSLTYELATQNSDRYYGNLIETTAAINPGNSGGPLFNVEGKVIGIVSAIETRSGANEGVGFAIPVTERTRRVIDMLARGEEVRYGYLGVEPDFSTPRTLYDVRGRRVPGVRISHVRPGEPADLAGLRRDDVILEFDGVPLESADHLIRVIGGVLPGDQVPLRYVRQGRERSATAVLFDRALALSAPQSALPMMNWRGAQFAEMNGPPDQDGGIKVIGVRPASDAEKRGLTDGQIVVSVNGERVTTLQQLRAAFNLANDAIHLRLQDEKVIRFPRG